MQCYGYEALCRALVVIVNQRYPGSDFDMRYAAEVLAEHGVDSLGQLPDLFAIADKLGLRLRDAA